MEDAVHAAFPFVKVVVKTTKQLTLAETPIATDGSACWKVEGSKGSVIGPWPRELQDGGFCTPRLGALEVQLAVWERGDPLPKVHLVHSKLHTLLWCVLRSWLGSRTAA